MGKRRKPESSNIEDSKLKRTKDNESEPKKASLPNNKPKKIVFDEDGNPAQQNQQDISSSVTRSKPEKGTKLKKNKNKNTQSNTSTSEQNEEQSNKSEDDEAKEEDIDKFCDEIEEEDNEQYENWVKLIEEKLTSNKKKT